MKKAVVLFSGGLDSTTALYWARSEYDRVAALSFDYGQRHKIELVLARRLTRRLCVPHTTLKIDLRQVGGSALTSSAVALPRYETAKDIGPGIPPTYVPFRNGVFLALAVSWAETNGIPDIVCGFNTIDSPDYPDTRLRFVKAMEKAVNLGTAWGASGKAIRIIAPFIRLRKSDIVRKGLSLGADYSYSISCYRGREIPCAKCSSCLLRQEAWKETGQQDHLLIRLGKEGKI
jgi:7-cyano-7-deazaguanine synthase